MADSLAIRKVAPLTSRLADDTTHGFCPWHGRNIAGAAFLRFVAGGPPLSARFSSCDIVAADGLYYCYNAPHSNLLGLAVGAAPFGV